MPYALISIHIPCGGGSIESGPWRGFLDSALKPALARLDGRELVIGGDFSGVLDDSDIIPEPSAGDQRSEEQLSQHSEINLLLATHGAAATDTWQDGKGFIRSIRDLHKEAQYAGTRLDTFALTAQTAECVTSMEHVPTGDAQPHYH